MKHTILKESISLPTYTAGEVCASGSIRLSPGIEIWFSDVHQIKTIKDAESIADLIISAPELLEENERLRTALTKANQYAVAWQFKGIQPLLGEDLDADIDYFYSLITKATS